MLIHFYNKLNKFFELIEPYKKIQESLKKIKSDGDLFPILKNKKFNVDNFIQNTNFQNIKKEEIENKKLKNKIKKPNEQNKESEDKNFNQISALDNFIKDINNFYTIKNEFFNFKIKSNSNFLYKTPAKIIQNNEIKNIQNEYNSNEFINETYFKNLTNKQFNSNITNNINENKTVSLDEFGKNLSLALKNAANNKSVANKY